MRNIEGYSIKETIISVQKLFSLMLVNLVFNEIQEIIKIGRKSSVDLTHEIGEL